MKERRNGYARVLSEEILSQQGSFRRVRRYLEGEHPDLGVIKTDGWSGVETIQVTDVIRPVKVLVVVPHKKVSDNVEVKKVMVGAR